VEAEPLDRAALREQLLALIAEAVPDLDGTLSDGSPLITSGIVESTTLLNLALWVEDRLHAPLDLGALDLAAEWDTVTSILDFVERHRAAP
jgi:hypothetical protein